MSNEMVVSATLKKVLVDVVVECDLSRIGRYCRDREESARAIEERARDFNNFIKDHRSQDDIQLSVRKIYEQRCSNCDQDPEMTLTDRTCANCGATVEVTP